MLLLRRNYHSLALGAVALLLALAVHGAGEGSLLTAGMLVIFTVIAWAFGLFVEPITSLVFFLFAVLFQVARPETVFSGFQSQAWWLVFGGSVIGIAVESTGLGQRLAGWLFGRAAGSYGRAVAAVALAAVGLAFVMPSTTGRILLLLPIVLAFAERIGYQVGRRGRTGLVLTMAAASFMPPTTILPANIPNTVLLGAAETLYGVKLTYGPYLLLHFPILGALKTACLIWMAVRLFPDADPSPAATPPDRGAMTRQEWRLAAILALMLILFATDSFHGVSPAWVALGAAIVCLLPITELVPVKTLAAKLQVGTLIYVAGFLGLGAVVADSGLGAVLSRGLLELAGFVPGETIRNVTLLAAIGAGLGLLTTLPGLPAVLTPLAKDMAEASGLPLLSVLMLEVVAFSTVFLPYQSPPTMIAMQLAGVPIRSGTKLCLAVAAVTVIGLLPLDLLWWRWLGYLP
ncbi:MAG: anion permease [Proteobacteria bacterium]|nr:anion permease [Pseudomonadota bacterium]MBI3498718.1 anion permease [Pseudomonadota bacterium]